MSHRTTTIGRVKLYRAYKQNIHPIRTEPAISAHQHYTAQILTRTKKTTHPTLATKRGLARTNLSQQSHPARPDNTATITAALLPQNTGAKYLGHLRQPTPGAKHEATAPARRRDTR